MKFATLGHFGDEHLQLLPKEWIHKDLIVSPEFNFDRTKGYAIGIRFSPKQMMALPRDRIQEKILDAVLFAQNELDVNLIQLGALTTSVTLGGKWLIEQKEYRGFVNHGDSYTASVTVKAALKILHSLKKEPSEYVLAIVGAYGIIGEAVSKLLVPKFDYSILIGRSMEKLEELKAQIKGNCETNIELDTKKADIIVTATSHPGSLLQSNNLKENAIIIDVSQPPNLSEEVNKNRPDIMRIDGGYVDFPAKYHMPLPGMPQGKLFACIVEVIMQAMENEQKNHIGTIDLNHLYKTEKWAEKYGFTLNELTNFGKTIF